MIKAIQISLEVVLCLLALAFASYLIYVSVATKVVTYSAPDGETIAKGYKIEVNGKNVDVYTGYAADTNGGNYSFASFDFSGSVTVKITSDRNLKNLDIQPKSAIVNTSVKGNVLTIKLKKPCNLSIEPNVKDNPLLLFANPIEENPPRQGDPNVIYYGPGSYKPGVIKLKSNQTLYIAGGAVVKGGVQAEGSNIKIMGRGILCGVDWEHAKGPCENLINLTNCSNVQVEGVTLRGCWGWTTKVNASDNVSFNNVKIVGGRVQNDDGIDPCNSRNVLINGCFIRTDDDCIAIKGLNKANGNVGNIKITNCTLWGDRARIMLLGHESRAEYMSNITVSNCDIIHYAMTPFLFEPGEEMTLEKVLIENVRLNREGQMDLITLRPTINQYMIDKVPGKIMDCTFKNIFVIGSQSDNLFPKIWIKGYDENHTVENINFENIEFYGKKINVKSQGIYIEKYTKNIEFAVVK